MLLTPFQDDCTVLCIIFCSSSLALEYFSLYYLLLFVVPILCLRDTCKSFRYWKITLTKNKLLFPERAVLMCFSSIYSIRFMADQTRDIQVCSDKNGNVSLRFMRGPNDHSLRKVVNKCNKLINPCTKFSWYEELGVI